ncbi:MAG: diaminopropionate ammonia-lyase [Alphaproteobacteria bacterium]
MNVSVLPEDCRPADAELFINPNARRFSEWSARQDAVLSREGFRTAEAVIHHWPGYRKTPLVSLDGLAALMGVERVWYKDEAKRFGLKSFKALGGAYAIAQLILREAGRHCRGLPISSPLLFAGKYQGLAADITVASATDGNHGRSVAWGAKLFGCKAVIYIHATVSEGRRRAIEAYGAEVRRVDGNYDDSVRQCAADAAEHGWTVISDTSYPGYMEIPVDVMQGYGVMAAEAIAQLPPDEEPTHVFVQGGVGGMAAAVAAHIAWRWKRKCPMLIVVEPERAACLLASAKAGGPTTIGGDLDTVMAGLSCGEPSLLAWEVLQEAGDAFMAIPDHAAEATMRLLARGQGRDRPLVAGESGVAGLAGAITASQVQELRTKLSLNRHSRVLVFGTEGATDPELYEEIVGRSAEDVEAEAAE